jgi:rare lipoprotein A (peptidoglycan hydrolase)
MLRHFLKGLSLAALFFAASFGAKSDISNARAVNNVQHVVSPSIEEHLTHATWYAGKCIGRTTAGGKRYDKDAVFVATHTHYPFGTNLKITNLRNHRSIVVPVEDREPYHRKHPNRTLDLSYAAAKRLDMVSAGVVFVSYSEEKSFVR